MTSQPKVVGFFIVKDALFVLFKKKRLMKKQKRVNIHESGHIGPFVVGWPFFIMGLALGVLLEKLFLFFIFFIHIDPVYLMESNYFLKNKFQEK